jgi:NADH:ubiquinone oxidoreductase subunit F (NADH-binding)
MTIQEIMKGLQQDGHGTKAMGGQVADVILPYVKSAHALDRLGHGKIVVIDFVHCSFPYVSPSILLKVTIYDNTLNFATANLSCL